MVNNEFQNQAFEKHTRRIVDVVPESNKILAPISGYESMPLVRLEEAVNPLAEILPEIQKYVSIAKLNCVSPCDGLTQDESTSIMLYLMNWEPLDSCLYFVLNSTLRLADRQKLKPWDSYLKLLITALSQLPSSHTTVYRGVKLDLSQQYTKGQIIVWWGFSSCITAINVLENDLFLGKSGPRTMFAIECNSGKRIKNHSCFRLEEEILLPAARQFEVVTCFSPSTDLHMVQMKEVEPKITLLPSINAFTLTNESVHGMSTSMQALSSIKSNSTDKDSNTLLEQLVLKCISSDHANLSGQLLMSRDMPVVIKSALAMGQCTRLDLEGNDISTEGISVLAAALKNNTTLKELELANNCFSSTDVGLLADALSRSNSTLQYIGLGVNRITDVGMEYLADMLKTNRTLIKLNLCYNKISNRGVTLLSEVLADQKATLQELNISSNKLVSDTCAQYLNIMLDNNCSLTLLAIENCNISPEQKSKLQQLAQSRWYYKIAIQT